MRIVLSIHNQYLIKSGGKPERGLKRTTNTFPGPPTKRHKFHTRPAIFPALRPEHARIGAPYIRAHLQCICGDKHALALWDKNGFLAILAAAARERSIFKTDTLHDWEDGCHTEGLIDAVVEVGAILELKEGYVLGIRAEGGEDCGA